MDMNNPWRREIFDEMDNVYKKAQRDEETVHLLARLEKYALSEADKYRDILPALTGSPALPGKFETLAGDGVQMVIKKLAGFGLWNMTTFTQFAPAVAVRFAPTFQSVWACTILEVLNGLEKFDHDPEVSGNKWILELQLPAEIEISLAEWETMMMKLYPWLSKAEELTTREHTEELEVSEAAAVIAKEKDEKRKKEDAAKAELTRFTDAMKPFASFARAVDRAGREIEAAIGINAVKGFSMEQWTAFPESRKLETIISIGRNCVHMGSPLICVDFVGQFPYCAAIVLLLTAWSGNKDKQMIDAGDDGDAAVFAEALEDLNECCNRWECMITNPVQIKIGEKTKPDTKKPKTGKKSFLKRLFGL